MLIRRTISLEWFLQIEGWNALFFIVCGYAVCAFNLYYFFDAFAFPFTGISFFGTAVAIHLGFRNNSAYERFWEARKAWVDLTNASRNFASQVMTYIRSLQDQSQETPDVSKVHREILFRHLAFVNTLRLQLRQEMHWEELKPWLPFGLVQHLGWKMLPLYATLATVFTITERIGSWTENLFDNKIEDVPLNAICRTIEIDLRQQLGELSVPPPLKPQGGVLM